MRAADPFVMVLECDITDPLSGIDFTMNVIINLIRGLNVHAEIPVFGDGEGLVVRGVIMSSRYSFTSASTISSRDCSFVDTYS